MKINSLLLFLIFAFESAARDPFFNDYPDCQTIQTQLQAKLSACEWIGAVTDSELRPILLCQDQVHVIQKKTRFFSSDFTVAIENEVLQFTFDLPPYCLSAFVLSLTKKQP